MLVVLSSKSTSNVFKGALIWITSANASSISSSINVFAFSIISLFGTLSAKECNNDQSTNQF